MDWHSARAALEWQVELGADEAIGEDPVDRYALAAAPPSPALRPDTALPQAADAGADPAGDAERRAGAATSLDALRLALASWEGCDLRLGATRLVFADGDPGARVMVVGTAPGRDEDRAGRPFLGREGHLLDAMFAAIGLSRGAETPARGLYLATVAPWRPPHDREPDAGEIALLRPFLARHIALADPDVVVALGQVPCLAILGLPVAPIRGAWQEAGGRAVLPMLPPAHLLRTPRAKRDAWADLLLLDERLRA